jgi:membrane-bound serine protease (ClpP class)
MSNKLVWPILCLAAGLILLIAEVFIPSGGVIAALATVCFGFAGWYAYSAWWDSSQPKFWAFTALGLTLIPATAAATLWMLSRTRLGNRVLLEGPTREEVDPYARDAEKRSALVGQLGRAVTLMATGGLVDVGGERHHAIAEGVMLEPGQTVKVVAVRGNRIVVRPAVVVSNEDEAPTEKKPSPEASGHRGNGEHHPKPNSNGDPSHDPPRDPRRPVELPSEPGTGPLDIDIPEG